MASAKPFLGEGNNVNRPPSFTCECYDFLKIRMQMFLKSQGVQVFPHYLKFLASSLADALT